MPLSSLPSWQKANARSTQVRREWGIIKRRLKAGELSLAEALTLDIAQSRRAIEVLGYAVIGGFVRWEGVRPPKPAGMTALAVAADCGLSHFVTVAALSDSRRRQLVDAAAPYSAVGSSSTIPLVSSSARS